MQPAGDRAVTPQRETASPRSIAMVFSGGAAAPESGRGGASLTPTADARTPRERHRGKRAEPRKSCRTRLDRVRKIEPSEVSRPSALVLPDRRQSAYQKLRHRPDRRSEIRSMRSAAVPRNGQHAAPIADWFRAWMTHLARPNCVCADHGDRRVPLAYRTVSSFAMSKVCRCRGGGVAGITVANAKSRTHRPTFSENARDFMSHATVDFAAPSPSNRGLKQFSTNEAHRGVLSRPADRRS